jgi:hypothetical protein
LLFLKVEQGAIEKAKEIIETYPELVNLENPKSG